MTDSTTPELAEPPTGTMLLALDPTPGYEGVVVGTWHRRDGAAWTDPEHHWFSSYARRMPTRPYTWEEALLRGAQPGRVLVEAVEPERIGIEYAAWCHDGDPDGIILHADDFGSPEFADTWARSNYGKYGITSHTLMQREHHSYPEGSRFASACTEWTPVAKDAEVKP